jgi:hypothetical protein
MDGRLQIARVVFQMISLTVEVMHHCLNVYTRRGFSLVDPQSAERTTPLANLSGTVNDYSVDGPSSLPAAGLLM